MNRTIKPTKRCATDGCYVRVALDEGFCPDCRAWQRAEAEAEQYAEGAWLRAAEAGTPDTWADEDRDRLIECYGYGPPA